LIRFPVIDVDEIAGHREGVRPNLLENPIEVAEKDPRKQVGAQRRVQSKP
jgi:hypothetical protein